MVYDLEVGFGGVEAVQSSDFFYVRSDVWPGCTGGILTWLHRHAEQFVRVRKVY
jgi:hypothetical protein